MEQGFLALKTSLVQVFSMSEGKADDVVKYLKNSNMSIKEMSDYLNDKYGYKNGELLFTCDGAKKSTVEDTNKYISDKLKKNTYSYYFSLCGIDCINLYVYINYI